jgi:hypothetical protein
MTTDEIRKYINLLESVEDSLAYLDYPSYIAASETWRQGFWKGSAVSNDIFEISDQEYNYLLVSLKHETGKKFGTSSQDARCLADPENTEYGIFMALTYLQQIKVEQELQSDPTWGTETTLADLRKQEADRERLQTKANAALKKRESAIIYDLSAYRKK